MFMCEMWDARVAFHVWFVEHMRTMGSCMPGLSFADFDDVFVTHSLDLEGSNKPITNVPHPQHIDDGVWEASCSCVK